jgi:hypothetical protein
MVAGLGTRGQRFQQTHELALSSPQTWQTLWATLEERRQVRTLRQRFRRNPQVYVRNLEALLLKRALPPQKKSDHRRYFSRQRIGQPGSNASLISGARQR